VCVCVCCCDSVSSVCMCICNYCPLIMSIYKSAANSAFPLGTDARALLVRVRGSDRAPDLQKTYSH
jgi:hypothetical protein